MRRSLALILFLFAAPAFGAPVRVATLLPCANEALALIPEQATVIATVRSDMHTSPPGSMADLGSPHSPSFEALAGANPQLVVGDRSLHAALASELSGLGAELFLLDTSSVESTLDSIAAVAPDAVVVATGAAPSATRAAGVVVLPVPPSATGTGIALGTFPSAVPLSLINFPVVPLNATRLSATAPAGPATSPLPDAVRSFTVPSSNTARTV